MGELLDVRDQSNAKNNGFPMKEQVVQRDERETRENRKRLKKTNWLGRERRERTK